MIRSRCLNLCCAALLGLALCLAAPAPARAAEGDYYALNDNWVYTLVHEVEVYNAARSYAFNIEISVPLLDTALPVYNQLIGEQLTPYPDRIDTDAQGHRHAIYNISSLKGQDSLILTQKYALDIYALDYTFDCNQLPAAYSSRENLLLQQYLRPEQGVESNSAEIMAFTAQAVGSETDIYRQARLLFAAVNRRLDYSEAALDQGAIASLARGSGNCEGYANLYLASLRAMGIPAKRLNGYLYQPEKHAAADYFDPVRQRFRLDSLRHTWVEFYVPDTGWVMADPTFTYTYTDAAGITHKFADWSFFADISVSRRYIATRNGATGVEKADILSATGGAVGIKPITTSLATGRQYLPFNDLEGHWARYAARDCVEQGLFNGVSAASFAPDIGMSRAMFVTVLGRYYQRLGGDIAANNPAIAQFADIKFQAYYADYLGWALDNQLIAGYGNARFGPDDIITREQMAAIFAAFILLLQAEAGLEPDGADADGAPAFRDAAKIAPWAREGALLCSRLGVITGEPDGGFYPQRPATRAQVAVILQRLPEY